MTVPKIFIIGYRDAKIMLKKYQLLVLTILVLFAVAGSSRFLRGDLLGGDEGDSGGSSSSEESLRTCSSKGTMFQKTENLGVARAMYKNSMSAIVAEREKILQTPSEWKCGSGASGEPATPELRKLAQQLPGWHFRTTVPLLFWETTVPVLRPVTFASFGAIVAEFQREYECKLTELQDRTIAEVSRNQDIDLTQESGAPTQFCCVQAGCREQKDDAQCLSPRTEDPNCGYECPVALYITDLAHRSPLLHASLSKERQVSRNAVERTLSTLRSFEMNYAIARQFTCYQRASLDLKNEMSLLADAVSCMPKIWDATTSIHDRKE